MEYIIRTNIVADFPSNRGHIYRERALQDLVDHENLKLANMQAVFVKNVNAKVIKALRNKEIKEFVDVKGFRLINKELVCIIEVDGMINPNRFIAHPYLYAQKDEMGYNIIERITGLVGVILKYKSDE